MELLNLNAPSKTQLPASAFPSYADVYVCDHCGRNITKHLRRTNGHTGTPLGREMYVCVCGRKYVTGAIEWDHLSEQERKRRIRQDFGLARFFSAILAIPGLLIYIVFHRARGGLSAALLITAFPFILLGLSYLDVAASIWRTRIAGSE